MQDAVKEKKPAATKPIFHWDDTPPGASTDVARARAARVCSPSMWKRRMR